MSETYNYIGARCRISGNPCGTDTHPPEAPCQCDTCRAIACIAELEAELKHCRKTAFADAYATANIENAGRIKALEAAALKVVETSGQVDHSGIYAYEMDYRRAIQRLAALLPGRGE